MKINLIGAPIKYAAKLVCKGEGSILAQNVSKKYANLTVEDSLSLSFRELGRKAAGDESIGAVKATLNGMILRAKGIATMMIAPFKKAYQFIRKFIKKTDDAASQQTGSAAGDAAQASKPAPTGLPEGPQPPAAN